MKYDNTAENWTWIIRPTSSWLQFNIAELWHYRHLLLRMVRRDFLIHHQQTLLGPLWILFQPLIVLITYILIFEKAVGLSTDGVSPSLFYFSGIILWNLFSECFTGTAFTFIQNGGLFSKVYFPRLIVPLSVIVLNYLRFLIQFFLFLILLFAVKGFEILSITTLISFVISSVGIAAIGLGLGLFFSILTAKYRDLINVIHLIIRLTMFATPIIYPLSMISNDLKIWLVLNPLTPLVELFRYGFVGAGSFTITQLVYSFLIMLMLVSGGSVLFNKFSHKLQDVL